MFHLETVRGSHYEMGRRHGCLFRHVIQASVHRWVMPHTCLATDAALDAAVDGPRRSDERFAPHLLDELRGIADGSGVPVPMIRRLHWRLWNRLPLRKASGCTAIGLLTEDGTPVVGGTLDDPREPYVLLRRFPKRGIPHVMIVWAGTAWGHNGINAEGLALASASVGGFKPDWPAPRRLCALTGTAGRLVLETCATVNDALALLRVLRPSAALVLGDAKGNLVVFQGYGTRQATAVPEQGLVFATNHVYLPPLVTAGARLGSKPTISRYSLTRFQVLSRARGHIPLTPAGLMALCRSHAGYPHAICNDGTVMASLASMRPCGGRYRLAIADRPPCRTSFVEYRL